jgi:hypothetical protein
VCFEGRGFCRYYVGIRESAKPCEWAYLSLETLELLKEYAGTKVVEGLWRGSLAGGACCYLST